MKTEHQYDPDCAEAAAELWEKLAGHEGEDNDAQLIIERALKDYACEADRRITSDEWAQKYRGACEDIGAMAEALEFYGSAENYRMNGYPDGDRPIWADYGVKARAALAALGTARPTGPHFVIVGYNGNRTPCAALTVYAASAGLDVVRENAVGMLHDAGFPQVKSADAIAWPNA